MNGAATNNIYSFNQGNTVLGQELGDHLGDWEHNAIRFRNGTPESVWYSQHSNGLAFTWGAAPKHPSQQDRLLSYSAKGSHANYATAGTHDHTIPNLPLSVGILTDTTSEGTLWDPVQSAYFYAVSFPAGAGADDSSEPTFAAYDDTSSTPVAWLDYMGHWGDEQLPDGDKRQQSLFGAKKVSLGVQVTHWPPHTLQID